MSNNIHHKHLNRYDIYFDYVNSVIEKKKYKCVNNLNIAVIAVRVFIDWTTPILYM